MGTIVGDKLRKRMDEIAQRRASERAYDMEYAVPGWVRPRPESQRVSIHRVIERKVSSGHKIIYQGAYVDE